MPDPDEYLDQGVGGLVLGAVELEEVKVVSLGGLLAVLLVVGMVVAAVGAVDVLLGGSNDIVDGGVLDSDSRGGVRVSHG